MEKSCEETKTNTKFTSQQILSVKSELEVIFVIQLNNGGWIYEYVNRTTYSIYSVVDQLVQKQQHKWKRGILRLCREAVK